MGRLVLKSPAEIEIMDEANRIVRRVLAEIGEVVAPGVNTLELDRLAERRIREAGGVPAFKGYPHPNGGPPFPGTICASINDEVVHGIPSPRRILREGDIVSVDVGVRYHGYYGDAAWTFPVGRIAPEAARLLEVTRECLRRAVARARPGARISDIGHAVQECAEAAGMSVVREFVGHGIGTELHEDPQVPNYGEPGRGSRLEPGIVLALEPMINAGGPEVYVSRKDGWTARTRDRSLSAHFEVSVAVTEDGPRVLGGPLPD